MADRYQDRTFPADDDSSRNSHKGAPQVDNDPLAELARLIGQTDPFTNFGRDAPRTAAAAAETEYADQPAPDYETVAPGPPSWIQRAARHQASMQGRGDHAPPPDTTRYAAGGQGEGNNYDPAPPFAHAGVDANNPSRYDDALFGPAEHADAADPSHGQYPDGTYPDDGYDYEQEPERKSRRGGLMMVAAVLALGVVGTAGAFAYRSYVGSPRSGEAPIIRAEPGPNKVVPPTQSTDGSGKLIQDRVGAVAGAERMVSREEQPVDVKDAAKSGPRVVFPPLNQNANPPSAAASNPAARPAASNANAAAPGDEPRRIRTLSIRPDQAEPSPAPASKAAKNAAPAAAAKAPPPPASSAPLSLSAQGAADARTRTASTTPAAPAVSASGNFMVQVSSQKTESDAQASYRALQGKFPSVLASRPPLIKRADLGDKGVFYRAMVGPFGSSEDATQFCGSLRTAGGQCVVQRN